MSFRIHIPVPSLAHDPIDVRGWYRVEAALTLEPFSVGGVSHVSYQIVAYCPDLETAARVAEALNRMDRADGRQS